ncbi:MAG: sulfurtransferase-like selenium metabolism protein YedF [Anaerolineae bacterium]|jgi:selenium metabolism protein YedF
MQHIDARGLACPQPVVLTRRAMQAGEAVVVVVDNRTAADNVTRMARRSGWNAEIEVSEGNYVVTVAPPAGATTAPAPSPEAVPAPPSGETVIFLASDTIGTGDRDLGALLMRTFIYTLTEIEPKPDRIICMNTGVRLAVQGSPVLDDLRALADCGVEILLCGTCLDYLGLKDQVEVGTVSNMYSLVDIMLSASKVVRM